MEKNKINKEEILHNAMRVLADALSKTLPENQTVSPIMYRDFESNMIKPTFYVMESSINEKNGNTELRKLHQFDLYIR